MVENGVPVKVTLKNEAGKEVARTMINAPGHCIFQDLSPGQYTATFHPSQGVVFTSPNPQHFTLTAEDFLQVKIQLKDLSFIKLSSLEKKPDGSSKDQESETNPPMGFIIVAAISMTLFGNLVLVEDFFSLPFLGETTPLRQHSSTFPRTGFERYQTVLPPELEARVKQCLGSNLKNLVGIPSLTELLQSLEKEIYKNEFQTQLLKLYKEVQQLRSTIENCDPALMQELMTAENQKNGSAQSQVTVIVVGEVVNVRVDPSLDSAVIDRVYYGWRLQVDIEAMAYLSQQEQLLISRGEGWLPIILPDGREGYVYSRYINNR